MRDHQRTITTPRRVMPIQRPLAAENPIAASPSEHGETRDAHAARSRVRRLNRVVDVTEPVATDRTADRPVAGTFIRMCGCSTS